MEKKISIIIPVFNGEKTIKKCIRSLMNQSYKNIEIIIVNDGSTDGTLDVCNQLVNEDNRLKLINKENGGVSNARNVGLTYTTGDYVTFMDCDDLIEPKAFEFCINKDRGKEADLISFGMSFDYYYRDKLIKSKVQSIREECLVIKKKDIKNYFNYLYDNNYLSSTCNKLFKTSIIKQNFIYFNKQLIVYEDFEFVLRYIMKCNKIMALSQSFYHYRNNIGQNTFSKRIKFDYFRNFDIIRKTLYEFYENSYGNLEVSYINGLLFRYYVIGLEKEFSYWGNYVEKVRVLKKFINSKHIVDLTNNLTYINNGITKIANFTKKRNILGIFIVLELKYYYIFIKKNLLKAYYTIKYRE